MGAVAVHQKIFDGVVNAAPEKAVELFHGYTYSGHPLACSAALAMQEIYRQENLIAKGRESSEYFLDLMHAIGDEFDVVKDVRGYGMIAGMELEADGPVGARGTDFYQTQFHQGLHVKTTGDNAIIAPALVAERSHIDELADKIRTKLKSY